MLSDLLKAYEHQHLGVDLSNARLVFDGSVLPLSQTISGAELESDDLVELRL